MKLEMGYLCYFACLSLLVSVVCSKDYYNYASRGNSCSLVQNGCTYQVKLVSTDCMVQDDPDPGKGITVVKDNTKDKSEEEIRIMEELEKKLTKMMEGLSVRSLRHIRQIRNDLRQMSTSMDLLKQQTSSRRGGHSKRGLDCPHEFVSVGTWGSCYRFSNFNATWPEAREYCYAFGADLVALDTLKESYIMDYLIKSHPVYEDPKGWWTSGNYIARNRKWMWTTKHHLKEMAFTQWAPGEPNSRSTMHCLLLYKYSKYTWHDATCTDKHNFICEIHM